MSRSFVEVWEWFHGFGARATAANDNERIRLYQIWLNATKDPEKYPAQSLALYHEGAALAEHLKEPWIEMFYQSLAANALIFDLNRDEDGLALSMKLVVKAYQDAYVGCPARAWCFCDLINAYFHLDGLSYTDEIVAMVDTLETQVSLDKDSYQRLFLYRMDVLRLLNERDKAFEMGLRYVEASINESFRLADGYTSLCNMSYIRGDNQRALEYSYLAKDHAVRSRRYDAVAENDWWQAVLLFLCGETEEAERAFRYGIGVVSQLERPKEPELWGGACRYYEVTGAYDKALRFWDEQVQLMDPKTPNRQSYFGIFLRRCYVLRKLGRLTEADVEQTRQAALRMRKPEKYLALIAALHDGSVEIPRY
jgi:hypothetical protein